MSDQDLEAIVMEILESSSTNGNQRLWRIGQRGPARRDPSIVRRRKRRSKRNPLRTSLRIIFLGLVILCTPLLFSV
jgi:hypothetical protein